MTRIVLDTNVWVSAILTDGPPRTIVDRVLARQFIVSTTVDLMDEFVGVLRNKLRYTKQQVAAHMEELEEIAELVLPETTEHAIDYDPDNRVLECAVAAGADVIVTGDKKHPLPLKSFQGIKILSPTEFLKRFR